jgi:hypothetical protein
MSVANHLHDLVGRVYEAGQARAVAPVLDQSGNFVGRNENPLGM